MTSASTLGTPALPTLPHWETPPADLKAAIREVKAALRARIAASGRTVEEVFAVIEARVAERVAEIAAEKQRGETVWPVIDYADIPTLVLDATTTAEDRSFWDNAGIDPAALISAVAENAQAEALWPYLEQQGQSVFRWAVWQMAPVAQRALDAAGIRAEDLTAFIPHQANARIIDAMVKQLKLPESVHVARDIVDMGNTSAASVPLALSTANGRASSIAWPTLSGSRPPESTTGGVAGCSRASSQSKVSPVPPGACGE